MNNKYIRQIVGFLIFAVGSEFALAHDYVGLVGNATKTAKTDRFYVTCASGADHVSFQVKDIPSRPEKASKIYIRADKGGASPAVTTLSRDLKDTDAGFSPLTTITGGSGAYFFNVVKSATSAGAEVYVARIHCYDAGGNHNPDDQPSTARYLINQ